MPQGIKIKQGKKAAAGHQARKRKPQKSKFERARDARKDGATTKTIYHNIEATMIGRTHISQETLKLVDKQHIREGTVNYGKGKSGRQMMKEGRTQRDKLKLNKN